MSGERTYAENLQDFANKINILRKIRLSEVESYSPDEDLVSELTSIYEGMSLWGGTETKPVGRGERKLPEFKVRDAQRFFDEMAADYVAEAGGRVDFALKQDIAQRMFERPYLEINMETGLVDLVNVTALTESQVQGDPLGKLLYERQIQAWNDPNVILKGNILGLTLTAAATSNFLGGNRDIGFQIANYIKDRSTLDPEAMDDKTVINWLAQWDSNLPMIRQYLFDGKIYDAEGKVMAQNVSGYDKTDTEASLNALIQWEMDNPTRIIDGESLVPQYGNDFTTRRANQIAEAQMDWGWDPAQSIAANVKRILDKKGFDADDKITFPDGDERYAVRKTREAIVSNLEDSMRLSLYDKGSREYAEEIIGGVRDADGKIISEGLMDLTGIKFELFTQRYANRLGALNAVKWDRTTKTGLEEAAKAVLDRMHYDVDDISEEDFDLLWKQMRGFPSLGDALSDESIRSWITDASEAQIAEDVVDGRVDLNKGSNLQALVKSAMRSKGLITATTGAEFEGHLDNYTIPEIVRRIVNEGGADSLSDVMEFVNRMTDTGVLGDPEQFTAYDVLESDYRRQFMGDPSRPPMAPGMTEFKVEQAFTPEPIPEVEFDIASLQPELQTLAFERPEFAKFLSIQMLDPEYLKAFKKVGQERLKVTEEGDVLAAETAAEFAKRAAYAREEARQSQAALEGYQRERAEDVRVEEELAEQAAFLTPEEEEAGMVAPAAPTEAAPAAAAPYDAEYFATFHAPDPEELEAAYRQQVETDQARAKKAALYTGAAFKKHLYEFQRIPGMTTEDFFRSRLPGFEKQFKGTAFEKAALARKQREEEAETSRRRQEIARTSARTIVRSRQ